MTSSPVAATLASKASLASVPSQPALHANEKGRLSGALSHGHPAHVRVLVNLEDRAPAPFKSDVTSLLTGAGFGRRPFSHSHWSRLPSLTETNCGVSCHPSALPRINSLRVVACKRSRAHSVAHQQPFKHFGDAPHVLNRLSSSRSSAGFKTSWKDLTFEAEPLSSDDKIHD